MESGRRSFGMRSCGMRSFGSILLALILGSIAFPVLADPPASPPPCGVILGPLFCFRVTDTQQVGIDQFEIMMEFVNWTGKDAAGIVITANQGASSTINNQVPFFSDASVDSNGRPFGAGSQPPAGNLGLANSWTVVPFTTPTKASFGGVGSPIVHRQFAGTSNGSATTFHGLLDPSFDLPTLQAECIAALVDMIPGSTNLGGMPPTIEAVLPETIDDGDNVLDGFVLQIDDFDPNECISFNWHLQDSSGQNTIGLNTNVGAVLGDDYGFGAVNLCRQGNAPPAALYGPFIVDAPEPLFNLNTGFDPPDTSDSNQDSALFWAEDEVDGVDNYFINPIPAGEAGQGTYFFIEMGAAITAEFRDEADAEGFLFDGEPVTPGANVAPSSVFGNGFESGDISAWSTSVP